MAVQNVKIPAKHYVGMVKRQHDDLPLGFITPWGEDAAAQKRIATVNNWESMKPLQKRFGLAQRPYIERDQVVTS